MTFTDDDLKRLKEFLLAQDPSDPEFMPKTYLALLARLEAAEKLWEALRNRGACYCETYEGKRTIDLDHTRQCKEEVEIVKAWREAAGK
jgi:hypothetical protein